MKRVYLDKNRSGSVVCEKCGKVQRLSVPASVTHQTIWIKCKCAHTFPILIDQRQHYRKDVHLHGVFAKLDPKDTEKGKIVVQDISQRGVGFATYVRKNIRIDDVVSVKFELDDPHKSPIYVQGIVKIVKDKYVGVELDRPNEHIQKTLGFYLMQDVTGRKRGQASVPVETPSNIPNSPQKEEPWNPFGLPGEKPAVGFKGDLRALPAATVLKTLSAEKKTGVLQLIEGGRRVGVCFQRGDVIAVSGNDRKRLGQRLIEQGVITRKVLDHALRLAKKTRKRLGETLVESRLAGEDSLKEIMRLHIDESIEDLSHWTEGYFEYQDCVVSLHDGVIAPEAKKESQRKKTITEKKREYSRKEVSWSATIVTNGGPISGEIKNVSLTGLLMYCRQLPDPKRRHRLTIEIGNHRSQMLATIEMIRLDVVYVDYEGPIYGIGMRFVEIDENDLEFLSTRVLR
jgi:hypothetical protein